MCTPASKSCSMDVYGRLTPPKRSCVPCPFLARVFFVSIEDSSTSVAVDHVMAGKDSKLLAAPGADQPLEAYVSNFSHSFSALCSRSLQTLSVDKLASKE